MRSACKGGGFGYRFNFRDTSLFRASMRSWAIRSPVDRDASFRCMRPLALRTYGISHFGSSWRSIKGEEVLWSRYATLTRSIYANQGLRCSRYR